MAEKAATALSGLPKAGEKIAGKYVIERVLAVGGMGAVMCAHDEALERRVAVKFMLPKALENAEVRARFLREARAAVAIRSEHVVDVYEVGVAAPDMPFIVMEYLPGRDLHKVLEGRRKNLEVEEAVDYVLQACEALAEAHSLGIVHRDIKPSNLFVTNNPDGSPLVKVLDFGISKTTGTLRMEEQSKSLTQSSVALGSPLYMSPEQVRNSKFVDTRTDIWSIGIVLYELLTKALPFDGETVPSLAAAIASDPPRPIREHRADIPAKLESIIMRCLEKEPAKRYQKVSEFANELQEFASPGNTKRAVVFDRIEQSQEGVSPLAFESTTASVSPLASRAMAAGAETLSATADSSVRGRGAATTAGLGTTRRLLEKKRSRGIWAAIAGAAVIAGVMVFALGGSSGRLRSSGTVTEIPSNEPASVQPATAVDPATTRITEIDTTPATPPPTTTTAPPPAAPVKPRALSTPPPASPAIRRPPPPKPSPVAAPQKPPTKAPESPTLPSALTGSR